MREGDEGMLAQTPASEIAKENATRKALEPMVCLRARFPGRRRSRRLLDHCVSHQIRFEHDLVRANPLIAQLVEERLRNQPLGDFEGALARCAGERVGVHVARARRHVPHAELVEVAAAFGQDAPELLMVALRPGLLVGIHGIAVEHPGPARAFDQARALHAGPVVELDPPPVEKKDPEHLLEGLRGA